MSSPLQLCVSHFTHSCSRRAPDPSPSSPSSARRSFKIRDPQSQRDGPAPLLLELDALRLCWQVRPESGQNRYTTPEGDGSHADWYGRATNSWDSVAGHSANLHPVSTSPFAGDKAISYYHKKGVAKDKIVVGPLDPSSHAAVVFASATSDAKLFAQACRCMADLS